MTMKTRIEKLSELASETASLASRSFSSVQRKANEAGATALAAGKSARQTIEDVAEHVDTQAAVMRTKAFASATVIEAQRLADQVAATVMKADSKHKEIADKVESVSMGLGITSGVVAAGAALAAPTGLSALGVALGITSAPLIVAAAPVIGVAATVTGAISGGAYFYSKWKTKRKKESLSSNPPNDSGSAEQ